MKKKLAILLLSVSLAASSFSPIYAADEFTDASISVGSSGEDTFSAESTSDPEDVFDAEDDFTSEPDEDDFFSDEKELVPARDGDVVTANGGQGITAGTSVYTKGSTFGRVKSLTQLKGMGVTKCSYPWFWASPESTSYYTDNAGNLHIVAYNGKALYDATCNSSFNITSTVKISLPLPIWGGFYAAPDGNFYVAVGQQNPNENDDLVVVKVLKYNRAWNLLGTTNISGGYSNMSKGIYIPFAAASLRMTQIGSTLIIHTGREMYSIDGVHHQSDITFAIDTQTMTLIDSDMPYNSHSFNQFVVNDGKNVYFMDHGDAFYRGLILSSFSASGALVRNDAVNIFPFVGSIGENFTGCKVTGFSLIGNNLVTVGKSVPHNYTVNGQTGYEYVRQNVYMILTDKNSLSSKLVWLTQYPKSSKTEVTEPKLIPVSNDRFVILYSEETADQKSILHYLLMDSSGNIVLSKSYKNVSIQTDSQPILWGHNITWVSGNYDNDAYNTSHAFLYQIPVVTTPLTGIALDQTSITLDDGNTVKLNPVLTPSNSDDVADISWTSSNSKIASVSSDGTVLGTGSGQAIITATVGDFQAQCQVTVKIPQTDTPLSRPDLTISQTSADQMHLTWNKITGAKGYQIYYRAPAMSSYKRIATIKSAALSYDASVVPGQKYYFKVRAYGTNASGKTKYSKSSPARSKTAIVPAPAKISCKMGNKCSLVSWSKVDGASGYVVYCDGVAAKTLKVSATSWKDTKAYDSRTQMYWIYNYYVRAFKVVNGKKVYSKPSKTVNFY